MKPKTDGYIVMGPYGICQLDSGTNPNGSHAGVLYHGQPGTIFETRSQAKQAIKRTDAYAEEMGYDNEAWTRRKIIRVHRRG